MAHPEECTYYGQRSWFKPSDPIYREDISKAVKQHCRCFFLFCFGFFFVCVCVPLHHPLSKSYFLKKYSSIYLWKKEVGKPEYHFGTFSNARDQTFYLIFLIWQNWEKLRLTLQFEKLPHLVPLKWEPGTWILDFVHARAVLLANCATIQPLMEPPPPFFRERESEKGY